MAGEIELAVKQIEDEARKLINGQDNKNRPHEVAIKRIIAHCAAKPPKHQEPRHNAERVERTHLPRRRALYIQILIDGVRIWHGLSERQSRARKSFGQTRSNRLHPRFQRRRPLQERAPPFFQTLSDLLHARVQALNARAWADDGGNTASVREGSRR